MEIPILRSLLFVPGNKASMLEKAMSFQPDVFVPDMEDSVADAQKADAREVIAAHLAQLHATGRLVIPRVNALDTGLTEDDLDAVIGPHVHGISIGKINTAEDLRYVDDLLSGLEQARSLRRGSLKLIPWIETALSIVHCYDICCASPRLIGAAFGAEDFTNDMQIPRSQDDHEVTYARNVLCTAARAARIPALDTPFFAFKDQQALVANALASKHCGFKGKFAIHPAQIEHINAAFAPSAEEVEQAQRIVAAFEAAERAGRGSTSLDGLVIDVPVVKRARALLAMAGSRTQQ
ncbi:MAG: CoA ester lyase [Gammaproteobacteria bacterium]|nr:CoA ester lyase [Gammaproteobacteria bacterium]